MFNGREVVMRVGTGRRGSDYLLESVQWTDPEGVLSITSFDDNVALSPAVIGKMRKPRPIPSTIIKRLRGLQTAAALDYPDYRSS